MFLGQEKYVLPSCKTNTCTHLLQLISVILRKVADNMANQSDSEVSFGILFSGKQFPL